MLLLLAVQGVLPKPWVVLHQLEALGGVAFVLRRGVVVLAVLGAHHTNDFSVFSFLGHTGCLNRAQALRGTYHYDRSTALSATRPVSLKVLPRVPGRRLPVVLNVRHRNPGGQNEEQVAREGDHIGLVQVPSFDDAGLARRVERYAGGGEGGFEPVPVTRRVSEHRGVGRR